MSTDILHELEKVGLEVAREIAGADAVSRVEVEPTVDVSDRPAYEFSVVLDPGRTKQRLGLIHIGLLQKLRDYLFEHNDDHQPLVELVDRAEWEQRQRA